MNKRLQIQLSDEARSIIEALVNEANDNFTVGHISYSDAINELILSAKVDLNNLRKKHTDHLRVMRKMAAEGKSPAEMIEVLKTLETPNGKRKLGNSAKEAI